VRLAAFAAWIAIAAASCATLPPCPSRGGPAWTEWTSPHVVLLTDLDEGKARLALRDFEELRRAVLAAAWRRAPEPHGRITAVLLRSKSELQGFVPHFDADVVLSPSHQAFIVMSGAERDQTVTDPIVRLLSDHYGLLGRVPWFDEGLARYLGGSGSKTTARSATVTPIPSSSTT
jgi:hypothetical protein